MTVLIVTQTVDSDDPILGFFVRWIEMLAGRVTHIDVICLKEGVHTLPANVQIHSLGKERGNASRAAYAWRFLSLIWSLRASYDAVFVHMNPEYVILGGLWWRLWNKRISLWYNHPHKGLRLWCAVRLAHRVFYTSTYAATAHVKKARRMPAGIDTEMFTPLPVARNRHLVHMQGRIMPSKHVETAIKALQLLRERVPDASLTLIGPEDSRYGQELRKNFVGLITDGAVHFIGPKNNSKTPALFSAAGVSLNLAASGHFDKSVLESMACGTPVVLTSNAFSGLVPPEWVVPEDNVQALAETLARLMALPEDVYHELGSRERAAVVQSHSLTTLTDALVRELEAHVAQ